MEVTGLNFVGLQLVFLASTLVYLGSLAVALGVEMSLAWLLSAVVGTLLIILMALMVDKPQSRPLFAVIVGSILLSKMKKTNCT